MLLTELRILIVDTGRVWWRQLPMIMGVYLLGWLGTEGLTPPQCRQSQCRIAPGYVGGLHSPLVQPQIGHPEPARHIFLQSEVR